MPLAVPDKLALLTVLRAGAICEKQCDTAPRCRTTTSFFKLGFSWSSRTIAAPLKRRGTGPQRLYSIGIRCWRLSVVRLSHPRPLYRNKSRRQNTPSPSLESPTTRVLEQKGSGLGEKGVNFWKRLAKSESQKSAGRFVSASTPMPSRVDPNRSEALAGSHIGTWRMF